jgi:hypothetical protein
MFNTLENHILQSIKDDLVFESESAKIIISADYLHKQSANNLCSVYVDCISNNPEYSKYENNITIKSKGIISLFINGKVKTSITKDKSSINNAKFDYANYVLRQIECLEITNFESILFDKYSTSYKTTLQNPRIAYGFDSGDGVADFGINFEASYILISASTI